MRTLPIVPAACRGRRRSYEAVGTIQQAIERAVLGPGAEERIHVRRYS